MSDTGHSNTADSPPGHPNIHRTVGGWVSQIVIDGESVQLGPFPTIKGAIGAARRTTTQNKAKVFNDVCQRRLQNAAREQSLQKPHYILLNGMFCPSQRIVGRGYKYEFGAGCNEVDAPGLRARGRIYQREYGRVRRGAPLTAQQMANLRQSLISLAAQRESAQSEIASEAMGEFARTA
jgi:hypothetical protein